MGSIRVWEKGSPRFSQVEQFNLQCPIAAIPKRMVQHASLLFSRVSTIGSLVLVIRN